jgi:hypothetical protein
LLRGLVAAVLLFCSLGAFAGQRMCLPRAQSVCGRPTPEQESAADHCRIEMKSAQCEAFFKDHPEVVRAGKNRNCELVASCSTANKISDYAQACLENWAGAWGDMAKGLYQLVAGNVQGSVEVKEREKFFASCTTAQCKRDMLGPYADLFSKEEIEGSPNDKNLNPADPVNQNYLQGYSAKVLYKKLLQRISQKMKDGTLDEPVIEPWSGKPAKPLRSADQMIDDALSSMGINNTACYDPVVVAEMRCYALFSILDPLIAVGAAGKIAGLAGKGAAKSEALYTLRRTSKKVPLEPSDGSNLLMKEVRQQGYKEPKEFRSLYVGKEEAEKMRKVSMDPDISDVELPSALFDIYKDARLKDLSPEVRKKVEESLRKTTVTGYDSTYLGAYDPRTNSIEISMHDRAVETIKFYDTYAHEMEHSIQNAQDPKIKKVLREFAAKTFSSETESRRYYNLELGAVKAQYDFLRGMPAEAVERMSKELSRLGFAKDAAILRSDWNKAGKSFEDFRAASAYPDMAKIKTAYPDQYTNRDRTKNMIMLTLIGGSATATGVQLVGESAVWAKKVVSDTCRDTLKMSSSDCNALNSARSRSK